MSQDRNAKPICPEAFASANAAYWRAYHACPAGEHDSCHEVALLAALRVFVTGSIEAATDALLRTQFPDVPLTKIDPSCRVVWRDRAEAALAGAGDYLDRDVA